MPGGDGSTPALPICAATTTGTTSVIAKPDGTVKVETLNRAGMQRNRKRLTSQVENHP